MRRLLLMLVAACGAASPPPSAPPAKEIQLNQPGVVVKVEDATLAGYVTIVDFWSESCGACVEVHARVAAGIANQAKTVLRKVDVGDGLGELARLYDISALPHYNIYDTRKRLRFILVGSDCLRAPELAKQLLVE